MSFTQDDLRQHAHQVGEAFAALILAMGMQAENQRCQHEGKPPVYSVHDFDNMLKEHNLGYNELIEKQRRFF